MLAGQLIFTYPIMVHIVNGAIETHFFSHMEESETKEKYIDLSRLANTLTTTLMAVLLHGVLRNFLSLIGAIVCAPLSFIIPCAINLKLNGG
jgi:hypothetical protein